MALPLLVCFAATAEVLHLMKALYCFRRPPLLLLYYFRYYITYTFGKTSNALE